jgi:hypothetical protein
MLSYISFYSEALPIVCIPLRMQNHTLLRFSSYLRPRRSLGDLASLSSIRRGCLTSYEIITQRPRRAFFSTTIAWVVQQNHRTLDIKTTTRARRFQCRSTQTHTLLETGELRQSSPQRAVYSTSKVRGKREGRTSENRRPTTDKESSNNEKR